MNDLIAELYDTVKEDIDDGNLGPAIPSAFNGELGIVDLAKPVDYTSDSGKVVIDGNLYSVDGNLAYQLWIIQDKPAAATVVTAEQFARFFPVMCGIVARSRIYHAMTAANWQFTTRASDCIVLPAAVDRDFVRTAYHRLCNSERFERAVADMGEMVLYSFVANGIHRRQNEGHSWYTDKGRVNGNLTSRTLAVAGAKKEDFAKYMNLHGHDSNHHLTDRAIDAVCDAITGHGAEVWRIDYPGITYIGQDVNGRLIHEVFKMSDSAIDRWPPGTLGKAALIVGIEMMSSMISDLALRAKITGHGAVTVKLNEISSNLRRYDGNKEQFQRIEAHLGIAMGVTYGYCVAARIVDAEKYMAFAKHAERNVAAVASGKSLAMTMLQSTPHPEAVAGGVLSAINLIADGLNSAGVVEAVPGGARYSGGPAIVTTGIKAEIGTPAVDKMMELIAGKSETFFEARS